MPRTPRRLCSLPIDLRLGTMGNNYLGGSHAEISTFCLFKDIYFLPLQRYQPSNERPISRLFDLTKGGEEKQRARSLQIREKDSIDI
nr:hypothetical protein [Tanacetum cinerariifolium]